MTPGGLRHQLLKHSNPSENANEIFSLRKWITLPPKRRLSWSREAKPNPVPQKEQAYKRLHGNLEPNYLSAHSLCRGLCLQKLPCTMVTLVPKQGGIWAFVFKRWPALTCQSVAPLGMTL